MVTGNQVVQHVFLEELTTYELQLSGFHFYMIHIWKFLSIEGQDAIKENLK